MMRPIRLPTLGRRAAAAAAAVVPLLTSGCGPAIPVTVGVKAVPLDILVGRDEGADRPSRPGSPPPVAEALPAVPVLELPSTTENIVRLHDWVPPPPAPSLRLLCPPMDPLRPAAASATPEVVSPAEDGSWPFRQSGTRGFGSVPGPATALAHRLVSVATTTGQGTFAFSQDGSLFGLPDVSFAHYSASNASSAPATPLVAPASQLGLSRLLVWTPNGFLAFQPSAPLELLATPAQQDVPYPGGDPTSPKLPATTGRWTGSATDTTGTTISVDASNLGRVRDNACGTPVEAWRVQATVTIVASLVFSGPSLQASQPAATNLSLTVTYDVATGLGGMIVAEVDKGSGTLGGVAYTCDSQSTVSAPQPESRP